MKSFVDRKPLITEKFVSPKNLSVRSFNNIEISFILNFDLPMNSKLILRLRGGRNNKNDWYYLQPFDPDQKGFIKLKTTPKISYLPIIITGKQLLIKYLFIETSLENGTKFHFTLKNTLVQSIVERGKKVEVLFELQDGSMLEVENPPRIDITNSEMDHITIIAPSMIYPKQKFDIIVRIEDKHQNLVEHFSETIEIYTNDRNGNREFLGSIEVQDIDGGILEYEIKNDKNISEIFFIEVQYKNDSYRSNPILSQKKKPERQLYWGYIHGHTTKSDGMRSLKEYFENLKKAGLDFGTNTEHDHLNETTNEDFEEIKRVVEENNEEHNFITLFGYEYGTWYTGYGDICIYYRDNAIPIFRSEINKYNSTKKLIKNLKPHSGKVLMIGHHTALKPGFRNWDHFNNDLERLVEIYSCWGNQENSFNQGNPMPPRYKFFGYGPHARKRGAILGRKGSYIQDALQKGYKLGFTAGGDDHLGLYPSGKIDLDNGIYPPGIMAIWAEDLTRNSLWNSLIDRKCYGTTGPRVIIEFNLDEFFMGDIIDLRNSPNLKSSREISIKIISPIKIKVIELIRNNEVSKKIKVDQNYFDDTLEDSDPLEDLFIRHIKKNERFLYYYARVLLEDKNLAWTSPIWIVQRCKQ